MTPRRTTEKHAPLVEPMSMADLIFHYGKDLPPVRLDDAGRRVCLSCPNPLTGASNRTRFCNYCALDRAAALQDWHAQQQRPTTVTIDLVHLDRLVKYADSLQMAVGGAVTAYQVIAENGHRHPGWMDDLSVAAKDINAHVTRSIRPLVRQADEEGRRRANQLSTE